MQSIDPFRPLRALAGGACIGVLAAAALLPPPAGARTVRVDNANALISAIRGAQAGDVIVLADGEYRFHGTHGADCTSPGTAQNPIVVRAETPFGAKILSAAVEAFNVSAPYWRFEGLRIEGRCSDDSRCEHAFHVVGRASGFQMVGNRILDFNAHLKVNANTDHDIPTDGLVDGNLIAARHPRNTGNPVSFVNIDNGAHWIVRGNTIADFRKLQGDQVSYGAFAKGGAESPVFEQNLVMCSSAGESGGSRVGLSFGGGGMTPALCLPHWRSAVPCDPETRHGIIRNNVVAHCSDVGIYLNRAADTAVLYNTLIGTGGVDFRFASSSGETHGNVLSSRIRSRDGGRFAGADNAEDLSPAELDRYFDGLLRGSLTSDGGFRQLIGRGGADPRVADDWCGRARRGGKLDWGALQLSLGDCPRPSLSSSDPGDGERNRR